jgi:hypothetical protein
MARALVCGRRPVKLVDASVCACAVIRIRNRRHSRGSVVADSSAHRAHLASHPPRPSMTADRGQYRSAPRWYLIGFQHLYLSAPKSRELLARRSSHEQHPTARTSRLDNIAKLRVQPTNERPDRACTFHWVASWRVLDDGLLTKGKAAPKQVILRAGDETRPHQSIKN